MSDYDCHWNESAGEDSDYLTSTSMEASYYSRSEGEQVASAVRNDRERATEIHSPPFQTPPKLQPVEQVMKNHTGTDTASLRILTTALAKDAIFGHDDLLKCSLSGRNNTGALPMEKLNYIKTLVQSRLPNKSQVEFEHIWSLCRSSLSKVCQNLRKGARKKL